jgi:hypothetical protein
MGPQPSITPREFVDKWRHASTLKERSAAQEHFLDLCRLLRCLCAVAPRYTLAKALKPCVGSPADPATDICYPGLGDHAGEGSRLEKLIQLRVEGFPE